MGLGMIEGAWNDSLTAGDMCGPLIKHKSPLTNGNVSGSRIWKSVLLNKT